MRNGTGWALVESSYTAYRTVLCPTCRVRRQSERGFFSACCSDACVTEFAYRLTQQPHVLTEEERLDYLLSPVEMYGERISLLLMERLEPKGGTG